MKITDEQLMAYADGELDAAAAAEVEAAIAADPALAEAVARHRALRRQLRDAFAPGLDEPVPEHLMALVRAPAAKPAAEPVAVPVAAPAAASGVASVADILPLRLLTPPVSLPTIRVAMAWHERSAHDPALQWLRETLRTISRAKPASGT